MSNPSVTTSVRRDCAPNRANSSSRTAASRRSARIRLVPADRLLAAHRLELVVEDARKVHVDPAKVGRELHTPRTGVEPSREIHDLVGAGADLRFDDFVEDGGADDHRPGHLASALHRVDDRLALFAGQAGGERVPEDRVGASRLHGPVDGHPPGGVGDVFDVGHPGEIGPLDAQRQPARRRFGLDGRGYGSDAYPVPFPRPMRRSSMVFAAAIAAFAALSAGAQTRMLRTPTVSKTQIAFAYANNIWIVDKSGGMARRLTSFQGTTENPKFSPDGKLIAFSAQYGGNVDVYVVPADGGEPKRLTWHPGADVVQGWTPDGKSIVFNSSRATAAPSAAPRFWTVPVEGGVETPMALPRAYQGKISPDGRRVAYRMNNSWDEERRNYRGGQNRPIWIVDLKTFALDTTPNVTSDLIVAQAGSPRGSSHFSAPSAPESKNMDPVWVNDDVIDFVSDRDGVANVWTYDTKSKKLTQATHFTNFDVKAVDAASDGSAVVFEQAGDIHLLDPKTGKRARGEHHGRRRLRVDDAAVEGRDART